MSFLFYLFFSAHGGVQSEEHGGCPIIGNNWLLVGSTWVHPWLACWSSIKRTSSSSSSLKINLFSP
jgi:hypothetical protein